MKDVIFKARYILSARKSITELLFSISKYFQRFHLITNNY